ncbi:membrane-anchored junction protein isoform X3 [Sceloporus undulatus]|uniref:membrane-anchored junction protein isoform X3 n=1 Tax=Sceloporus undulatus TaxID=8520 RepID=UPI001C4D9CE7|nr:membrane-anchored junction protein isoform X3 [Sceloporus undulatus]
MFCQLTESWISEHRSLKPFTYPVPETRFFHVGVNVYKFKIKYSNTVSINNDLHESDVNEELQDAVRVILGNLDNLCPFTTEHLIIFPYLNKWERVSDLRFMYNDVFLVPYPYVCTIYVELNSGKQNTFAGKAAYSSACTSVNNGCRLREHMERERAINWRRLDSTVGVSHTRLYADRKALKNVACVNNRGKAKVQEDMIYPKQRPEETRNQYCDSATVDSCYDKRGLWEHMEYIRTENAEDSQQEEQPILQKGAEENIALRKEGFLELLKSLVPPLLQRIFNGTRQLS